MTFEEKFPSLKAHDKAMYVPREEVELCCLDKQRVRDAWEVANSHCEDMSGEEHCGARAVLNTLARELGL